MQKLINIFVGGSINRDISNNYRLFAKELGNTIGERDYQIIFDGCTGLPSIVFENLKGFDRSTVCYTEHYITKYFSKCYGNDSEFRINRTIQLKNQSEMTNTIIELSDAFIFMKGHIGTLEEIFRVINSKKNKEHDHPIVIVNINHEWDDLITILNSCNVNEHYYVTDNVIDCLNFIESELYKESSYFYKNYVINKYTDRLNPIIEENIIKKSIK